MSVICPRCGFEDDGTSFNCPRCFAVLQPDLVPEAVAPARPAAVDDDTPGPVGRLLGRAGRRVKGEPASEDTVRSAPAVGPDGLPRARSSEAAQGGASHPSPYPPHGAAYPAPPSGYPTPPSGYPTPPSGYPAPPSGYPGQAPGPSRGRGAARGGPLPGVPAPGHRPLGAARRPLGSPDPPTYLWQSILATLFCCQPFGIVAIVFSALTMGALGKGNWADAVEHSNRARLWLWLAVLSGVVILTLLLVRFCSGGGRLP